MSMFSKQPVLPPAAAYSSGTSPPATRRSDAPPPVPAPLAHFAIVGTDLHTGRAVSTVLEARSEDDAQELARRRQILVEEIKPMHPLAGVAAVKLARRDPQDIYNTPPTYAERLERAGILQVHPDDLTETSIYSGVRAVPPTRRVALLGVLGVLAMVGALLWSSLLRDGGLTEFVAMILPGPQTVEAAIDLGEPLPPEVEAALAGVLPAEAAERSLRQLPSPVTPLRLEALLPPRGSHRGSAVIAGELLQPGHSVQGYRLVAVRSRYVLLQKNDQVFALWLSVSR